jgi:hypothetical protein
VPNPFETVRNMIPEAVRNPVAWWISEMYDLIEHLSLLTFAVLAMLALDFVVASLPQGTELIQQFRDANWGLLQKIRFVVSWLYAVVTILVATQLTVEVKRNPDPKKLSKYLLPLYLAFGTALSLLNLFLSKDTILWINAIALVAGISALPVIAARWSDATKTVGAWLRRLCGSSSWSALLAIGAVVLVLLSLPNTAVPFSRGLSTLPLVYFAFGFWTLVATLLFIYLPRSLGLPALPMVPILMFAGFSYCNENHRVRTFVDRHYAATPLREYFKSWVESRCQSRFPGGKALTRCPVILVGAEGGGIRAAFWTSQVLAQLDLATEGAFSKHVFAISGVSGGAVGSAAYVASLGTVPTGACGTGLDALTSLFSDDYLSPIIGGMLFPDFLARFSFKPVNEFDRARPFESALEQTWSQCYRGDAFSEDMNGLYEGVPPSVWRPALLFNSTNVETGRRFILSNIALPSRDSDAYFAYDEATPTGFPSANPSSTPLPPAYHIGGMPLSAAVHLASRFPYVSPQGVLWAKPSPETLRLIPGPAPKDLPWGRLVDGGYFDGSGMATLIDLAQALSDLDGQCGLKQPSQTPCIFDGLQFLVVYISNGEGGAHTPGRDGAPPAPPLRPVEPGPEILARYVGRPAELNRDYPAITETSESNADLTSPLSAYLHAGWAHGDAEGSTIGRLIDRLNERSCKMACQEYFEISYNQFLTAYLLNHRVSRCGATELSRALCADALYTNMPGLGWVLASRSQEALKTLATCSVSPIAIEKGTFYTPPLDAVRAYRQTSGEPLPARLALPETPRVLCPLTRSAGP